METETFSIITCENGMNKIAEYGVKLGQVPDRLDFWFSERLDDMLNDTRTEADWEERTFKAKISLSVFAVNKHKQVVDPYVGRPATNAAYNPIFIGKE